VAEVGEAVTAMHARDMERTSGPDPASFIGEFAFPRAALEFETESLRAVAPHFTKLNAAPAWASRAARSTSSSRSPASA
jgi:hypothetical protein